MSGRDEDALIAGFISITSADPATARFFLESAQWNLDAAASAFFENPGAAAGAAASSFFENPGAAPAQQPAGRAIAASNPPPRMAGPSVAPRGAVRQPGAPSGPRVAGFSDLAAEQGPDEDEETQDYFAGGEKSGQVVRAPKRTPQDGESSGQNDLAKALLEQARNSDAPAPEEMDAFRERQNFSGAGFRLGDVDSVGPSGNGERKPDVVGRKNVSKTLTFYRDGFTVDDGEFRRLDDPRNQEFLTAIQRGFVPTEMEEPGLGNVSVNLVDKHNEDYVPTRKPAPSFAGSGMRLGGPSSSSGQPSAPAASSAPASVGEIHVDESLPIVTIQVRLHDGTKLKARFNENHTIEHLRQFVSQAQTSGRAFELSTTYPKKKLEDGAQALRDSNLNGAVVLQSLL